MQPKVRLKCINTCYLTEVFLLVQEGRAILGHSVIYVRSEDCGQRNKSGDINTLPKGRGVKSGGYEGIL